MTPTGSVVHGLDAARGYSCRCACSSWRWIPASCMLVAVQPGVELKSEKHGQGCRLQLQVGRWKPTRDARAAACRMAHAHGYALPLCGGPRTVRTRRAHRLCGLRAAHCLLTGTARQVCVARQDRFLDTTFTYIKFIYYIYFIVPPPRSAQYSRS